MSSVRCGVLGGILVLAFGQVARAQGSYEIQVYGADLVEPRSTMVELHSNFTPRGLRATLDATQPNCHALHETLEITHGFSGWLEVGFYQFTSARGGDGWQWVGSHIRPRVSAPKAWKWPVGVSLSQEIGYQRRQFSTDTWTWEIRPILDQQLGPLYWGVNVAFERALAGENRHNGFDVSPAAKVSYQINPKVSVGAEYYADLGRTTGLDPLRQQGHQVFPSVDLNLSPEWEFNAGVGFGLTAASDPLVVKVIIGRRLPF
jgi:hypothetical protein